MLSLPSRIAEPYSLVAHNLIFMIKPGDLLVSWVHHLFTSSSYIRVSLFSRSKAPSSSDVKLRLSKYHSIQVTLLFSSNPFPEDSLNSLLISFLCTSLLAINKLFDPSTTKITSQASKSLSITIFPCSASTSVLRDLGTVEAGSKLSSWFHRWKSWFTSFFVYAMV
jgi:hypothetical protein